MSKATAAAGRFREYRNAKALRDYHIEETFEAGIKLTGTEVKSIRLGGAQLNDAFARMDQGIPMLYHLHIAEYRFGNLNNHAIYRPRLLLVHAREAAKLRQELDRGGKALIPLRLYFKKALIKIELALCTPKKLWDKREDIKQREDQREITRAMRRD